MTMTIDQLEIEPCTREDLQVGFNVTEYYTYADWKDDNYLNHEGTSEIYETKKPDEWKCSGCGEFFKTERAALKHLKS